MQKLKILTILLFFLHYVRGSRSSATKYCEPYKARPIWTIDYIKILYMIMFCNYVITQIYTRPEGIPIFGVNFFGLTAQLTDHLLPPGGGGVGGEGGGCGGEG